MPEGLSAACMHACLHSKEQSWTGMTVSNVRQLVDACDQWANLFTTPHRLLMWELTAMRQGGGTGGLAFFDTIYKAATLPASWEAPNRDLNPSTAASPKPIPTEGGLVATMSDLHHEQHTARPELYVPKARRLLSHLLCIPFCVLLLGMSGAQSRLYAADHEHQRARLA